MLVFPPVNNEELLWTCICTSILATDSRFALIYNEILLVAALIKLIVKQLTVMIEV